MVESLEKTGISQIYPTRDKAQDSMLEDIRSSKQSCWISAAVYVGMLIKPEAHDKSTAALMEAGERALACRGDYRLSFCSLSPEMSERSGAGNAYLLECWRRREEDDKVDDLRPRIRRGSTAFDTLARKLTGCSAIRPERRFFRDYLIPHSLVVIDESIVYVSFYDWATPSGQQSLTIRFQGGLWGDKFVEESRIIRSNYSYRDYRVIVFDFDGVIADSMDAQARAWRHAARTAMVAPKVEKQLLSNFWMGAAGPRMFEHISKDNALFQQLRQAKDAEFECLEPVVATFEDSARILGSLKEAGHKVAIATTATNSRVQSFLKRHSLANYFDKVVTDFDVERGKPHPEMLREIAEHFQCQPWQICFIGDTSTDYDMSRRAGTDFVLFQSHEGHGVPVECVTTTTTWRQLGTILITGDLSGFRRGRECP